MFGGSKKPYTAITVQIENLTSEQYEENDYSGIFDLVEVIRLQNSGPSEAARAIRKKLKYGNVHRQLRALTLLDCMIQNAGPRFQREFADEPLLERLRVAATDPVSDQAVRSKCKALFAQWAVNYKNTPGLGRISTLYKQLPQRKKPQQAQQTSKVLKETEAEAENNESRRPSLGGGGGGGKGSSIPTTASSSSTSTYSRLDSSKTSKTSLSKPKKEKSFSKPFNLEKEKPQLLQCLASSSVASTNLMNALKLVNRESKRVSEDPEVVKQFETCKLLRRQILRYIVHVESEQWLGGLIHANEELVNALRTFEVLDKSVEYDSDSEEEDDDDDEWDDADDNNKRKKQRDNNNNVTHSFAGLSLGDDRKGKGKGRELDTIDDDDEEGGFDNDDDEDEDDENDPFADRNAISTPQNEPSSWKPV